MQAPRTRSLKLCRKGVDQGGLDQPHVCKAFRGLMRI